MVAQQTPQPEELYGPHIHAPVWPWSMAGWTLATVFALSFLMAWIRS